MTAYAQIISLLPKLNCEELKIVEGAAATLQQYMDKPENTSERSKHQLFYEFLQEALKRRFQKGAFIWNPVEWHMLEKVDNSLFSKICEISEYLENWVYEHGGDLDHNQKIALRKFCIQIVVWSVPYAGNYKSAVAKTLALFEEMPELVETRFPDYIANGKIAWLIIRPINLLIDKSGGLSS